MFSFFEKSIPEEVVKLGILPHLTLQDALAFRQICTSAYPLFNDNQALKMRIQEEFGITVHGRDCLKKYMIMYFFNKGIFYLLGAQHYDLPNKKLSQLANAYFTKANKLIAKLGLIEPQDQQWVNYKLGYMYLSGHGVEAADTTLGVQYLEHSAAQGNSNAMLVLAYYYSPNLRPFLKELKILHTLPYHLLLKPNLLENQENTGLEFLLQSIKKNNPEAIIVSSSMLRKNYSFPNTELNLEQAINLLTNTPHPDCIYYLATTKLTDCGGEIDLTIEEALNTFKAAADLGSIDACYSLKEFYLTGSFPESPFKIPRYRDANLAMHFMEKAIQLGSSKAAYERGKKALDEKKKDEAIKYFELGTRMIADYDLLSASQCALALAELYQETDLKKALMWYQRGAELGDFKCCIEAGFIMLHHPLLVKNNPQKTAEQYFDDALLIGPQSISMNQSTVPTCVATIIANLSLSYSKTIEGTAIDLIHYLKWKFRAAVLGNLHALKDISALFTNFQSSNEREIISSENSLFHITTKNESLAQELADIYEKRELPPLAAIHNLAMRCYQALNLPEIDDPFLKDEENYKNNNLCEWQRNFPTF